MNEFAHMAEHYYSGSGTIDLVDVSMWLAQVPCSPLYGSHISPDRALLAALGSSQLAASQDRLLSPGCHREVIPRPPTSADDSRPTTLENGL